MNQNLLISYAHQLKVYFHLFLQKKKFKVTKLEKKSSRLYVSVENPQFMHVVDGTQKLKNVTFYPLI